MRLFVILAVVFLLAGADEPAYGQSEREVVSFVRVATGSSVVLDRLGGAGHIAGPFRETVDVSLACVTFHNTDVRAAKSVRVNFVYYNDAGDRSGGDVLTRNGLFASGARIDGFDGETRNVNLENCMTIHRQRRPLSAVVAYVDRVDFSDGTTWTSSGVRIPDHVAPGSQSSEYGSSDVRSSPATVTAAGFVPADGNELAPFVLEPYANCGEALAAHSVTTPLFSGVAVGPAAPDQNVFVSVQPGSSAGGSLYAIGDATVCAPSGNSGHDVAAVAVIKALRVAIPRAQVFRVYFPAIAASGTCVEPPRLMNRVLTSLPPLTSTSDLPRAGEYITVARVNVDADGRPVTAVVGKASGQAEFDDAARHSALASRYWPALVDGKPVAGTFDFAMRWTIEGSASTEKSTTRVFGPLVAPPALGCVIASTGQ